MSESSYGKEYKRLFDYWSSIKFSYSRPFHKEHIDVHDVINKWPLGPTQMNEVPVESVLDNHIFDDEDFLDNLNKYQSRQNLPDDLNELQAEESKPLPDDTPETNFDTGFGEGSGRVIQNLKNGGDVSIFSAATLPDVKQSQPSLLSVDCEYKNNNKFKLEINDQIEKLKLHHSHIRLRENVRSFFRKTHFELHNTRNKKETAAGNFEVTDLACDYYGLEFMEPPLLESVVQVVQVGQLPVTAAAQNPVTCDPRVTQVSDASPSQCSVENGPNDDSPSAYKTEYTELTTADLSMPLVDDFSENDTVTQNQNISTADYNIPIETEIKSEVKVEIVPDCTNDESNKSTESNDFQNLVNKHIKDEFSYESNNTDAPMQSNFNTENHFKNTQEKDDSHTGLQDSEEFSELKQQNGSPEKIDQIAHAMNAAGITISSEHSHDTRTQDLVDIFSQKLRQGVANTTQTTTNTYSKSINALSLQQALAQILPPGLNQTNNTDGNQQPQGQILQIVQGKTASGNQITVVDNSQQSVINTSNSTPVLHIVQNKGGASATTANGTTSQPQNTFAGLSLVDTGLQQGGNQLLHIVNTGNQKNNNASQLLKRVNLLTNLQGANDQKMVQFVCKSADGKAIQLNAPHQRSMVLRLQPIDTPSVQAAASKPTDAQELNTSQITSNSVASKDNSQQEIKSRSIYEENYAKFIQNSSAKPSGEKSTSLPKFNQAFGKPVFQEESNPKPDDITSDNISTNTENVDCSPNDNALNLDHIGQISSPPLLLRKSPPTCQAQPNLVQQIKQTIAPMNIQTMHGGVIYTRQIPVNIGGGQTINLITVPSTELMDDSGQNKSEVKFVNQGDMEQSIIKIVPQQQNADGSSEENNTMATSNENGQTPQPQPVLTQMRIKLPMLSKNPQMVGGARVVRPSFFQIQRNVISGANQPVYQQLVLTAAPPLGQQTIRLPLQTNRIKVPSESSTSESQMSTSTLEQLREFDMVLEQVKERSTVQPNLSTNNTLSKLPSSSDTTDSAPATSSPAPEPTQTQHILYSIGNNHNLNVAYVNRKATITTPVANFVRSPDSSGIADSSTTLHAIPCPHHNISDVPKPKILGQRPRPRPKPINSSTPMKSMATPVPPKPSNQKPLEDEQTTQRILYILAEYKEQVENSPDKDKPAPRRRSNPPANPSTSHKRKKSSSSSSRRSGGRDSSPVHGDDAGRTMGSEDSSCGTSQGDCADSCVDSHSPQGSPRKVARKLSFEPETPARPTPQRNVIVADGQTIAVTRATTGTGKPTTAVLMPANYILPVSMVKGGQQIAIVTNRGPKLLTVGSGEGGTTNALLLQRLIGPAGLKPVLTRPGVRHVRLPAAALQNLQAFNLAAAVQQPADSTASPAPVSTPPDLVEKSVSSPWAERDSQDAPKTEHASSPEGSEPWNLPSSADINDYGYEETVRAENMDRTVLDTIQDQYSPEMEAQIIFDKMFDVASKKSFADTRRDSPFDIEASDSDDKSYQVVQKKDGESRRIHRVGHVSSAALRHKYAMLEHELRLQKSLSEECEDLGVDSPSAAELFPEAELLFATSPAPDAANDAQPHTPQPIMTQTIPQPDMDDQIATDQLIQAPAGDQHELDVNLGLEDVGIAVNEDGSATLTLEDPEEFARRHPNTTFHTEPPTEDEEVQPFSLSAVKRSGGMFPAARAPATVLMATPHKYDLDNVISTLPPAARTLNLASVLKEDGLTRFDSILTDTRELHLSNTASAIVHSSGNATQVIRRVYEDDKRERDRFLLDEPESIIAGDDAKMVAEDSSRDATMESMPCEDEDASSPERHAELFWESNSASERSESRRPLDFSSDSEKCCKSPSYDETNSTDSSGVGTHMRLDSVIKEARGLDRSGSADGSSADDHPPLRTYPAKRSYHGDDAERSLSGKTRAGEACPDTEVRRRASGRGVVKRGCHCCNGSPAPARKKPRQRKPTLDFNSN